MLPSDQALVFVNNHDNQRGHGAGGTVVEFQDDPTGTLADERSLWPIAACLWLFIRIHRGGLYHLYFDSSEDGENNCIN